MFAFFDDLSIYDVSLKEVSLNKSLYWYNLARKEVASALKFLGVAVALAGAGLLWWELPRRQVSVLKFSVRDAKARADIEDNFRKTNGQLLAGIAVAIGTIVAYVQFQQQQQTTRDLNINNQVAKGFEQLGSDILFVRIGGIYTLESIMRRSPEYHRPVLEALGAFIRERARQPRDTFIEIIPPATDIQAALTVIGRRDEHLLSAVVPDLRNIYVPKASMPDAFLFGADLSNANLSNAYLADINLIRANLTKAHLKQATLYRARLTRAWLEDTDLTEAQLSSAQLASAWLMNAILTKATLNKADLSGAFLLGADLSDADLSGANLSGVDLSSAKLMHANLSDADLVDAIVNQHDLDEACGKHTKLPQGLTIKPC